ncbi:MAG: hypothetical protein U9Q77_07490 [Candidatus Marinimicrobia bacterium]|nr:hypothetical protein [Candidatus Neomarinimicrobiota bacterium]
MNEKKQSIAIRIVLITAFLLTVLFTLLSGVGTYCAAFKTEQYPSMAALLPYQLLYQILVIASISIGLWGLWGFGALVRKRTNAYRNAIIILSLGLLTGTIQMITSEIVRGNSVPVNFRVYLTLVTLLMFLFAWWKVQGALIGLVEPDKEANPGLVALGSALVAGGILTLTTHLWVGDSHFAENGYSWVYDLKGYLLVFGGSLVFSGSGLWLLVLLRKLRHLKSQNVATLERNA